jgi:sugar transferase (PEP-CTERM/EpsH1 system associated)
MEDLLLLVHRMPYPPNKGDKIRSYHLLRELALHYRVHLATFVDDDDDWRHVPVVQALCASSHFGRLVPLRARLRSLGALLHQRALSFDYYRDGGLRDWVAALMTERPVKRIVVFSAAMAQYAEPWSGARRVVDFCDVDSDKWRQYAEKKSWPAKLIYRYEAARLLAYEREVARSCDAALFVSREEAALFRHLAPESAGRTGHLGNGVDTAYFSPDFAGQAAIGNPYPTGQRSIVFTGAMDYWPNIDAVGWFAREILPRVLVRHPDVRFHIVGARPAADVRELAGLPGVAVSGTVPDVRPYLAHAALAVAPLRVARGIQNKVLEAMAMARTVVLTPQALEGIEARAGSELLLAADAAQFADAVCGALDRPDPAIGAAARARVEAGYGWTARLAPLMPLLEGDGIPASSRRPA